MEIDEDNKLNNSIQEGTEESVVESVSEDDELLARIAQRNNLPTSRGRQAAVRGNGYRGRDVMVVQDVESGEELYVPEVAGEIFLKEMKTRT